MPVKKGYIFVTAGVFVPWERGTASSVGVLLKRGLQDQHDEDRPSI